MRGPGTCCRRSGENGRARCSRVGAECCSIRSHTGKEEKRERETMNSAKTRDETVKKRENKCLLRSSAQGRGPTTGIDLAPGTKEKTRIRRGVRSRQEKKNQDKGAHLEILARGVLMPSATGKKSHPWISSRRREKEKKVSKRGKKKKRSCHPRLLAVRTAPL